MKRREFLSSLAVLGATVPFANAQEISGGQPWQPGRISTPPPPPRQGGLQYFTPHEFDTVGAIAERFIPEDELSVSGKEAGCAIFIDRQLAGDYGKAATLYRLGRFVTGTPEQGPQHSLTPAETYRLGLKALDSSCQKKFAQNFINLSGEQQDQVLQSLEAGNWVLDKQLSAKVFFEQLLQNVREGFLSDPLYGGNKGMVSWKMIGFPGARYDFRDLLSKKGKKLDIIPTSLIDNTL
jgi:gluconate 2-dehydrogenase gamma chain